MALVPRTPPSLYAKEIQTSIPGPLPVNAPVGATDLVSLWGKRYWLAIQYQQEAGAQTNWPKYWQWYRAFSQAMTEPVDWWRSNDVIPTCFKIVETLVPKHILGMFDQPEWFSVRGTEGTDERWELAITALLKEQLEEMNVFPTMAEALRYAIIMGHVWGKVVWKEEYTHRQILQPQLEVDGATMQPTGRTAFKKTTVTETLADRPDFQYLPLDVVKADPTGMGRWFIEEFDTTLQELVAMDKEVGGLYQHLDLLKAGGNTVGGSTTLSLDGYREPQSTEGISQYVAKPPDPDTVGIWQCWGWIPEEFRSGEEEWRLVVIANRSTVIRDVAAPTPDGKPPYFPIKYIPVPGLLYGESILKYIGPLQDAQTRISNHRLDEVYLGIWGQYIIDRNSGITASDLLFQPGGALEVNGNPRDKVARLERQPVLPDAWKEDDYRQTQAEHIAGATDVMQGVQDTNRPTATGDQIKFQQGSMRFAAQTLWLDQTFKKELLSRTYRLLQMRMPQERVMRIVGTDGMEWDVPLDITTIQLPVDIVVSGGLLGMSKQARLDQTNELLAYAASPVFGPYINAPAALRKRFREMGWNNVDDYIRTDEQVQIQQMMGMAPMGLGSGQKGPQAPRSGPPGPQVGPGGQGVGAGPAALPGGGQS